MKFYFLSVFLIITTTVFAQDKPNVILILTDDQGYGDITSHGNLKIATPSMDRIADEGARMDNFYVSSVCAPTRAGLLTGRYHIRTGVLSVSENLEVMKADEVTIAEVFKQSGYKTACFGKWHNGKHYPNHPNGQGFDEFTGFCGGHFSNYINPTLEHNDGRIETKGFISDVLTDKALEWIKETKDTPFFCYIPYNAPHTPYQVPDKYYNRFARQGYDVKTSTIYGMIENLDDNIGRILNTINDLGIDDNTIVVFLTDNGPQTAQRYNSDMKGYKTHVDEGGERVPFFIKWKNKIPEGLISNQISAYIDILPTLADLCQIPLPPNLKIDGISFKNYLFEENEPFVDRMIFSHRYHGGKLQPLKGAVRTQLYRYVLNPDEEGLYDMLNDPKQTVNLKAKKPKQFEQLKKAYANWFADVCSGWKLETVIPCGYDEFPTSELSVVESRFTGDLQFKGRGFTEDWLINWINPGDSIIWDVDFVNSGKYKFTLEYQCPQDDIGSEIILSVGDKTLKVKVDKAFDEPLSPTHDRAPRSGELQKPWAKLEMGELNLKKGQSNIILTAKDKTGEQVMELFEIKVERTM